jgi:hypothetical protein
MTKQFMALLFVASILAALLFGWVVSEVSYQLTREAVRDKPQTITLVIPPGTSQRVAAGQKTLSLPENLDLVQGDVLLVKNEDSVSHQLGPIWVPAGRSSSLNLDQASDYTMECSFRPSRSIDLTVRPTPTIQTRLMGIVSVGLPSGVLLWLYGVVALSDQKVRSPWLLKLMGRPANTGDVK